MKWLQISILAVLVAGPSRQFAASQTKTVSQVPVRTLAPVNGADLYVQYCAVCHGRDGHGNGPAAAALKPAPADLTQIARKNGGKFPTLAVQQSIASSDSIVAHGAPGMPVWGELLAPGPDNPSLGELRIHNLTKYIEGLQR
jgi:mono/diheme cytochrome c family protein